jgi:hypothetical protein
VSKFTDVSIEKLIQAITLLTGSCIEYDKNVFGRDQATVNVDGAPVKGLGGTPREATVDLLHDLVLGLNEYTKENAVEAKFSHPLMDSYREEDDDDDLFGCDEGEWDDD